MHVDLEQQQADVVWRSRFCVVGGGIAGLLLARRLARSGASVHVLEAGGLELEERSQDLFQAEMADARHAGTLEGRFRAFGGSSIRWGGQLLPYTPDVFRPSPAVDAPAWPIAYEDVRPFYDEVADLMHVGTLPFSAELLPALGHPPAPLSANFRLRYSKWAPFSQRNLAHTVGRECIAHPRITIFTHANVAELTGSGGSMTAAAVLNYQKEAFTFHADTFIVAAGTVESSRLLLHSPTIPNMHDQVGRYFHDHVSFHAADVPYGTRQRIFKRLGPFFVNGTLLTPKLEATPEAQVKAGLLAVMAHFVVQEPEESGVAAIRKALTSVQHGNRPSGQTLLRLVRTVGGVAAFAWALKMQKRRAVSPEATVWLNIDMEQRASSDSRVRLSASLDKLGLRKAVVDWRSGAAEKDTAVGYARLLRYEFERAGVHDLQWAPGLLDGTPPELVDTYHPMGGLRMGTRPENSVVNSNLRVHGLENLYVASCAVYPSGGSSNPTFTLMALALRLADHLLQC